MIIINNCKCMYDEKILVTAMLWFGGDTRRKKKHIYIHGRYPAVSIYDKKIHVHRLLLMFKLKRVLNWNEYAHHKDKNILNANIDNIELMEATLHQKLHRGNVKLSETHKKNIGIANKRRKWLRKNGRYYTLIHEEEK